MNKPTTFLLLFLLTLLGITVSASEAAPKQQAGTQHDVTIFFANDVRGETEPCG
jgi:2',3'-cyclic-nucleotide 2'-phosphodiesterase (5'-nucleotidase family)